MSKRLAKPLLLIALGIMLLLGVLAIALPSLVSSELVRGAVERELTDFTGQPVTLGGDIDLTLFPTPVAQLRNVVIPPRTDAGTAFLEVESINVNIAPLTLLSRSPQFTGFELERPRLYLVRDADGHIKWRDGFARIANAATVAKRTISKVQEAGNNEPVEPSELLTDGFPGRLGTITVSGGTIRIQNENGDPLIEATSLEGRVDWPSMDTALNITGNGILRGIPLTFSIASEKPLSVLAEQTSQAQLSIQSDIANLSFNGTLGFFDDIFAEGQLSLGIKSMASFLEFIDIEVTPGKAISAVEINGPFSLNDQKISFSNLDIVVDGNAGKGVLEFAPSEDQAPLLAGTLDFENLDMSSFLSAFIALPNQNFNSEEPIDLSFISQLRTDLRISAATANFGELILNNIAATAQINPNAAIFDLGDAETYGGSLQARLQILTDEQGAITTQFNLAAQDINTATAREPLGLPDILPTGVATVSLDAEAPFGSWASMIQQASGLTTLKMGSGTTQGFGVSRLLESDIASQFFTLTNGDQPDEQFDALSLNGTLNDGVVAINNAEIVYPAGTVTFDGVAPFRSGGIALTATATPTADTEADAPKRFFIGGSWDRAFATPLLPGVMTIE